MKPIRILAFLCISLLLPAQLLQAPTDKPAGVKSGKEEK